MSHFHFESEYRCLFVTNYLEKFTKNQFIMVPDSTVQKFRGYNRGLSYTGAKGAGHLWNFWTELSVTRWFWQFYYIMLCFNFWPFGGCYWWRRATACNFMIYDFSILSTLMLRYRNWQMMTKHCFRCRIFNFIVKLLHEQSHCNLLGLGLVLVWTKINLHWQFS